MQDEKKPGTITKNRAHKQNTMKMVGLNLNIPIIVLNVKV